MNEPITIDEFERLLMAFEAHPYMPEYKQVMDAYRAAIHYATLTQTDDDSNTWECSNCGGAWCLEDGTPQENDMHYCHKCGAYIEAFISYRVECEDEE